MVKIPRHNKRPPELKPLVEILHAHSLRYIVTGSAAARFYGVQLVPGDFDVTPALDPDNLKKLIAILREIEATPENFGRWVVKPDGEKKWVEEKFSQEKLDKWQPDINDITSLDHLFYTKYGDFDVVPELAGEFTSLSQNAMDMELFGCQVWIAHVDELLAKLTLPRREKDIPQVQALREIQRARQP